MTNLLLLLLTLQRTPDAATVTLTHSGTSAYFPGPASGKIRITSTCSADLPAVLLRFYRGGGGSNGRYTSWKWITNENRLRICCRDSVQQCTSYPFTPDCGGGDVTITIQLTADEVQVWYKREKVAARMREGRCGEQPEQWNLQLFASSSVTATDEGYKLDKALYERTKFLLQKYVYWGIFN